MDYTSHLRFTRKIAIVFIVLVLIEHLIVQKVRSGPAWWHENEWIRLILVLLVYLAPHLLTVPIALLIPAAPYPSEYFRPYHFRKLINLIYLTLAVAFFTAVGSALISSHIWLDRTDYRKAGELYNQCLEKADTKVCSTIKFSECVERESKKGLKIDTHDLRYLPHFERIELELIFRKSCPEGLFMLE